MFGLAHNLRKLSIVMLAVTMAIFLPGCGGGGGSNRPAPLPASNNPPADTILSYTVSLTSELVIDASNATSSLTAQVQYNETAAELALEVDTPGVAVTGGELRRGFAGARGESLADLVAGSTADTWELAATGLTDADVTALENGGLFLQLYTDDASMGVLRGQILVAGVSLRAMHPSKTIAGVQTLNDEQAVAWLTHNSNSNQAFVHTTTFATTGLDQVSLANARAGLTGNKVADLVQNADEADHWFVDELAVDAILQQALTDSALYLLLASPTYPAGLLRGQYLADGSELVVTQLSSGEQVATAYTTIESDRLYSYLRDNPATAQVVDAVELRQAPIGLVGPLVGAYLQNGSEPDLWELSIAVAGSAASSLHNQGLYIGATFDMGSTTVRDQLRTAASMAPVNPMNFLVESVVPVAGETLASWPDSLTVSLNRVPDSNSVSDQSVVLFASGGDMSFGEANDVKIQPNVVSVNGNNVTVDVAGLNPGDDTFLIQVSGDAVDGLADETGIVVDGDGDGQPGGNFTSAFAVATVAVTATLSEIQASIFTPSCAISGCHSGSSPPDGLSLSAGASFGNTVNVASVQMPSLSLIDPGNPDDSYLVRKVEGGGIVADRMPRDAAPLSQDQIDLIRAWVSAGAPND